MIYRYKSSTSKYKKDYKSLEEALKEFPELKDDDNPDDFGIIYGIEEGKRKPTMKYLVDEGVWILL